MIFSLNHSVHKDESQLSFHINQSRIMFGYNSIAAEMHINHVWKRFESRNREVTFE